MAFVTNENLKSVREYIKELAIVALVIAVVTLFRMYYNLNDYIIHTLTENNSKMEMVIERNTEVIKLEKYK